MYSLQNIQLEPILLFGPFDQTRDLMGTGGDSFETGIHAVNALAEAYDFPTNAADLALQRFLHVDDQRRHGLELLCECLELLSGFLVHTFQSYTLAGDPVLAIARTRSSKSNPAVRDLWLRVYHR